MAYDHSVAQIDVTDPAVDPISIARVQPSLETFGEDHPVRSARAKGRMVRPPGDRNLVIRFPGTDAARERFFSEFHAGAKVLRQPAWASFQTIKEGM